MLAALGYPFAEDFHPSFPGDMSPLFFHSSRPLCKGKHHGRLENTTTV